MTDEDAKALIQGGEVHDFLTAYVDQRIAEFEVADAWSDASVEWSILVDELGPEGARRDLYERVLAQFEAGGEQLKRLQELDLPLN